MQRIMVTGGAGFIGSALVRQLIRETADEVLVLDALTYAGNLASLREVGAGLQISPNAVRVIAALGLWPRFEAISARSDRVELRDSVGRQVAGAGRILRPARRPPWRRRRDPRPRR